MLCDRDAFASMDITPATIYRAAKHAQQGTMAWTKYATVVSMAKSRL
jgi:hypothetical protein